MDKLIESEFFSSYKEIDLRIENGNFLAYGKILNAYELYNLKPQKTNYQLAFGSNVGSFNKKKFDDYFIRLAGGNRKLKKYTPPSYEEKAYDINQRILEKFASIGISAQTLLIKMERERNERVQDYIKELKNNFSEAFLKEGERLEALFLWGSKNNRDLSSYWNYILSAIFDDNIRFKAYHLFDMIEDLQDEANFLLHAIMDIYENVDHSIIKKLTKKDFLNFALGKITLPTKFTYDRINANGRLQKEKIYLHIKKYVSKCYNYLKNTSDINITLNYQVFLSHLGSKQDYLLPQNKNSDHRFIIAALLSQITYKEFLLKKEYQIREQLKNIYSGIKLEAEVQFALSRFLGENYSSFMEQIDNSIQFILNSAKGFDSFIKMVEKEINVLEMSTIDQKLFIYNNLGKKEGIENQVSRAKKGWYNIGKFINQHTHQELIELGFQPSNNQIDIELNANNMINKLLNIKTPIIDINGRKVDKNNIALIFKAYKSLGKMKDFFELYPMTEIFKNKIKRLAPELSLLIKSKKKLSKSNFIDQKEVFLDNESKELKNILNRKFGISQEEDHEYFNAYEYLLQEMSNLSEKTLNRKPPEKRIYSGVEIGTYLLEPHINDEKYHYIFDSLISRYDSICFKIKNFKTSLKEDKYHQFPINSNKSYIVNNWIKNKTGIDFPYKPAPNKWDIEAGLYRSEKELKIAQTNDLLEKTKKIAPYLYSPPFIIPHEARIMHTYVLGGSGSGKSTLLKQLIYHDIQYNCGVLVLDPHGELVKECASFDLFDVGKFRDKLVFFNPETSKDGVIPTFNLLEHNYHNNTFEHHDAISKRAAQLVLAFEVIFRGDFTDNMNLLVLNGLRLLMQYKKNTLEDFLNLLQPKINDKYEKMIENHWDESLKLYFRTQFRETRLNPTKAAILTRFNSVLATSHILKHILTAKKSSIKIREALNKGKVVLINASQGIFSEEGTRILGSFLTAELTSMALDRSMEGDHKPIFAYIDECQNFLSHRIDKLLSEARKYKIHLTMANQYLGQFSGDGLLKLKKSIMSNTEVKLCGKASYEDKLAMSKAIGLDLNSISDLRQGKFAIKAGETLLPRVVKCYNKFVSEINPEIYLTSDEYDDLVKEQSKLYCFPINKKENSFNNASYSSNDTSNELSRMGEDDLRALHIETKTVLEQYDHKISLTNEELELKEKALKMLNIISEELKRRDNGGFEPKFEEFKF